MAKHKRPSAQSRENFFQDVYEVVKLIPPGKVSTYGAIARYLGAGKSARMVGYALNGSFAEQGVPAHRVVNRLGELTGRHHFPPERPMAESLQNEGVPVEGFRVVNLAQYFWDPSEALL